MRTTDATGIVRFGAFELDVEAGQLRNEGRVVRLPPQPFKLLSLLVSQPGRLVTREEIRNALWANDTFVDVEQGVNFAIKQVRDALNDPAEHSLYIQTVPKRGYRFIAPVHSAAAPEPGATGTLKGTDLRLQKVLWSNIAELRLAEAQRTKKVRLAIIVASIVAGVALAALLLWWL